MEEVERWMKMARDDLDSARVNFENGKYYVCAFLSQQAVEKALKSILLKNTGNVARIHDLVILGRRINLPKDLLDKCELLSKVYIETRYGILSGIPSQEFKEKNTLEYINIAKEVFLWIEKNI